MSGAPSLVVDVWQESTSAALTGSRRQEFMRRPELPELSTLSKNMLTTAARRSIQANGSGHLLLSEWLGATRNLIAEVQLARRNLVSIVESVCGVAVEENQVLNLVCHPDFAQLASEPGQGRWGAAHYLAEEGGLFEEDGRIDVRAWLRASVGRRWSRPDAAEVLSEPSCERESGVVRVARDGVSLDQEGTTCPSCGRTLSGCTC